MCERRMEVHGDRYGSRTVKQHMCCKPYVCVHLHVQAGWCWQVSAGGNHFLIMQYAPEPCLRARCHMFNLSDEGIYRQTSHDTTQQEPCRRSGERLDQLACWQTDGGSVKHWEKSENETKVTWINRLKKKKWSECTTAVLHRLWIFATDFTLITRNYW